MNAKVMQSLADLADLATVLGAPFAVVTLVFTTVALRSSAKTSRAQFWLELEKMFAAHDPIHLKLRPGGVWASGESGPSSTEDWAALEDYMGLFEHCELLLRQKLIDWETFARLFSYRVFNVIGHPGIVRAKLVDEMNAWELFIGLVQRIENHNSYSWRLTRRWKRGVLPNCIEAVRVNTAASHD
jgi:hypothetical protein